MPAHKGNKHGKQFSSDYQASGEAKSEGKKEAKAKKEEIKTIKEVVQHLFKNEVPEDEAKDFISKHPNLKNKKITEKIVLISKVFARMNKEEKIEWKDKQGNKKSVTKKMSDKDFIKYTEFLRDTGGEKPIDKHEIDQTNVNIEIKDKKIIDSVINKLKGL